jgi:hypothetical protein
MENDRKGKTTFKEYVIQLEEGGQSVDSMVLTTLDAISQYPRKRYGILLAFGQGLRDKAQDFSSISLEEVEQTKNDLVHAVELLNQKAKGCDEETKSVLADIDNHLIPYSFEIFGKCVCQIADTSNLGHGHIG